MSIPSSLQKVGYIPPTITTFKKRSLICLSYRSYLCVKTQSLPAKDSRILCLSDNQQNKNGKRVNGAQNGNEQVSFPFFILHCLKEHLIL